MPKPTSIECRALAAEVISAVIRQQGSLTSLLPPAILKVASKDQGLLQDLCYGTLRYFYSLSALIKPHISKPLKEKDADINALLIVGAYQLHHSRIPPYAAINSCVNGVLYFKKPWAKALVNGVLRNTQRAIDSKSATNLSNEQPALYDHPQWLIDSISEAYPNKALEIFSANNAQAPMTLRVNQQHQSRDQYLSTLLKYDIPAHLTPLSVVGLQLDKAIDVKDLPGFAEGEISVQDEAAQLCAYFLNTEPNMHVLDACAAPGGKSCHLLEIQPTLKLTVIDIDAKRCKQIRQNVERLNLHPQNILTADAAHSIQWWKDKCSSLQFDRILLDAPCSATGVIRRHPDIKLLRREKDISILTITQLQLLRNLWPLLTTGGSLLYATCSVLPEENDAVISKFLSSVKNATIDLINVPFGHKTEYGLQLLPQINGHDGFYFCRLIKI